MSNYLWNTVKAPRHGVNTFDLSHEVKTTSDFGRLTPIACEEVLPGDKFRVSSELFARLSPLITPVMQNMDIYVHWFFVPNRIIWKGWERFITQSAGGRSLPVKDGSSTLEAPQQLPSFKFTKSFLSNANSAKYRALFGNSSLPDYLGLQVTSIDGALDHPSQWTYDLEFNALPFVAYQRIWYDYYRDQNIDTDYSFGGSLDAGQYVWDEYEDAPVLTAQGSNIWADNFIQEPELILGLRYRSYRKDYFTSALPFVQKGSDISLPISGEIPVSLQDTSLLFRTGAVGTTDISNTPIYWKQKTPTQPTFGPLGVEYTSGTTGLNTLIAEMSKVDGTVNLSDGVSVTINELRRANALQKWEEANARGGTRYVEQVLAHFGVVGDDARMQRAEYLGGGRVPVNISEVLQTSETTNSSPQGNPAGRGVAAGNRLGFTSRMFKEHGWIMGILTIMPKASYFQGARRFFGKRHWEDFGWPLLANLGEQPVYRFELYNNGIPSNPESSDNIFGYTPRYAEYKFSPDKTCGDFRDGLLDWHLARRFDNVPRLNSDFLHVKPENNNRVFAVEQGDHFWLQIFHNIKVIRHLPRYGTPTL